MLMSQRLRTQNSWFRKEYVRYLDSKCYLLRLVSLHFDSVFTFSISTSRPISVIDCLWFRVNRLLGRTQQS